LNIGADGDFWLTSSVNTVEEKNLISWRIEDGSEGARISAFREAIPNAPHSILFNTRTTGGLVTEKARIDSSGRLLVGTSTAYGTAFTQIQGSSSNTTDPGSIFLRRGYTSTEIAVFLGTELGLIDFGSKDGGVGARISSASDGTWSSTSDCPSRLVFSTTADGAASPTERMRITSAGLVGIGTTAPGGELHIAGSDANTDILITEGSTNTDARIRNSNGVLLLDADVNNENGASAVVFGVDGSERARIDSSGRLLVGTSTARSNFFNSTFAAHFQIEGTSGATASTSIVRNTADAASPILLFGKTRGTSLNANTVVTDGDQLGYISFGGADGSEIVEGASIFAAVDGTPGTNDMPGRIVLATTSDGASSPTERMRIKSTGIVNIANTPTYADNAAATAGGLVAGDIYRTSTGQLMIRY
jgi:hypothetical protein